MKKKLLSRLCAMSILGCMVLATTPVFAKTYLTQTVKGGHSTSEVELGDGTRYFYGTTLTKDQCTARAYKDVDWSPDKVVATIYPKANGGYDEDEFSAEDGSKYYGYLLGRSALDSATLSFSN